jgi:hypothetical protein
MEKSCNEEQDQDEAMKALEDAMDQENEIDGRKM